MANVGSLAIQIDTAVPAVYVFLADPFQVKIKKSVRIAPGIIVNLDSQGRLVAVELLGPADLDYVMTEVAVRFNVPELAQLEARRHVLEEVLSSTVQ